MDTAVKYSGVRANAEISKEITQSQSTASLTEALGLSGEDECSLQSLMKNLQGELLVALEELTSITTYDDNLEHQYKEAVSENTKLHRDLERARNEIRHLRGKLSIIQMTSAEIREEKARVQLRERRRLEQERIIDQQKNKGKCMQGSIYVPTAAERARTVNAKGEYVDNRLSLSRHRRTNSSTYPASLLPSLQERRGGGTDTLAPPLIGCGCSECNSRQTFRTITLGNGFCQGHLTNQMTKGGEQILLGNKVILKGDKIGTVAYIGKLAFDVIGQIYIGVQLNMPVGNCDGSLRGHRYFQSPPQHGVFIKPAEVTCVTGRKPVGGVTLMPRMRERLPTDMTQFEEAAKDSGGGGIRVVSHPPLGTTSSHPVSRITGARNTAERELAKLKHRTPYDWADESATNVSKRKCAPVMPDSPALPTTTPTDKVNKSSSFNTSVSPLPPISVDKITSPLQTTPPGDTPTSSHVSMSMETKLLALLEDADLGSTGFVTSSELKSVLVELYKLTPEAIEDLLTELGVAADDGVGVSYQTILPGLLPVLDNYN